MKKHLVSFVMISPIIAVVLAFVAWMIRRLID